MEHYRRNFLTNVVLRADLDGFDGSKPDDKESPIARSLGNDYSVVTSSNVALLTLNVDPAGSTVQKQVSGTQWEHRKKAGGTKVVFLAPTHLSVEYGIGDFDRFAPFATEFKAAIAAMAAAFPAARVSRVGLRYVNVIKNSVGNPLDWKGWISASLIQATFAGMPKNESLIRSMHQLQTRDGDIILQMHYGIHNPEFPAPVARKEFILDFDCFSSSLMPLADAARIVDDLNKKCESAFETSIENDLRKVMEPIDDKVAAGS